ncbi:MAG: hypothetical protein FWE09_08780 [Treponema sp.]|nr:hypothetical protein [Treponema sp.]
MELLGLAPQILRARAFRLYAQGGRRIVDLWQNGGAAALGHKSGSLLHELKNYCERGLSAPAPHFMEARCFKALQRIFPGRHFRIYASPPRALEDLAAQGLAALWRPFENEGAHLFVAKNAPPILVPVSPGIQAWRAPENPAGDAGALPIGFCALAIAAEASIRALPPGDFLPPALLAVAARGLHDIIAATDRARRFPRVEKALRAPGCAWRHRGIYLTHQCAGENWEALFRAFLDAGFLLPPDPCQPAILPGELSAGEEARLAELLGGDT